jgi:hypothetical protein
VKRPTTPRDEVVFKAPCRKQGRTTVISAGVGCWYHFVQNGDTPAQVRARRYQSRALRYARRSRRGRWTNEHTRKLKVIVDSEDDVHLDEIQEMFVGKLGLLITSEAPH